MTNLLTRMADAIKADFTDSPKKSRKDNPIDTLNGYLRDCEKEVEKVANLVERQRLLKKELTKELEAARSMAAKREEHVRLAEEAGENELAQAALREFTHYQGRRERLEMSVEESTNQLTSLEELHSGLKHKLKDMYIKRLEVMGRENVAEANKKAEHAFSENPGKTEEELRFKKIENYLKKLETGEKDKPAEELTIDQQIAQLQQKTDQNDSAQI
ncbi:PspA/IM30 family protein [Jeotgalibacillus proteolyticus]|uniref:Modulator protein n=1 Tax=Jeotgalibacillus proteolyticus TaxID=2082395 RepID=A0A2S5G7D4_9BACL|nr:PspA/IM30 family protein [Jeotgalibacillus proteolyticus]PPA68889.1 modulator protein [Jeotgalibacillus proteolyticus]